MKNLDKKGFMLTETLVVATFVVTTLVFLYTQFRNINRSYMTSFQYNNTEDLYLLGNVADYLKINGIGILGPAMEASENKYIDITSCPIQFLSESEYCETLLYYAQIEQIIFTKENLSELKEYINSNQPFQKSLQTFITSIRYDEEGIGYRLIAKFENGTYATLKIL